MNGWPTSEKDLFPPVKAWLEARGAEVFAEFRDVDVIGVLPDGRHVAVELKRFASKQLANQGWDRVRQRRYEEVWVAFGRKPRTLASFDGICVNDLGLLLVNEVGVEVLREATRFSPKKHGPIPPHYRLNVGGSASVDPSLTTWKLTAYRVWLYLDARRDRRVSPAELDANLPDHYYSHQAPAQRRVGLMSILIQFKGWIALEKAHKRGQGGWWAKIHSDGSGSATCPFSEAERTMLDQALALDAVPQVGDLFACTASSRSA